MLQIRPVSDLRNKFPDIERIVNAGEPVYLTKTDMEQWWYLVSKSIQS